ncbi:MAG: nucleotidyltransferase [Planctomycetota bacterium]
MTTIQASANPEVDEIVEAVCLVLQLTDTQFKTAEERYAGIARYLQRSDGPVARFTPSLYPQGSMASRTTVRPLGREEFDLDIICCLEDYLAKLSSDFLYHMVLDDLRSNGNYRDLIEPQKRCIRLNYKGEFHLDIVPACPDTSRGDTGILIPDRELSGWVRSDPKAYATWFNALAESVHGRSEEREIAASAEPVPDNGHAFDRLPLQRTVQLMKRRRSVYYGDDDLAPKSIVLTTLAGNHYTGQTFCTDALLESLDGIIATCPRSRPIVVRNPVDPSEDFTRSWTPKQGWAFLDFVEDFRERISRLIRTSDLGSISEQLTDLFGVGPRGGDIGPLALKQYGENVRRKRDRHELGLKGSGAITVLTPNADTACKVSKNTFFGN